MLQLGPCVSMAACGGAAGIWAGFSWLRFLLFLLLKKDFGGKGNELSELEVKCHDGAAPHAVGSFQHSIPSWLNWEKLLNTSKLQQLFNIP